MCLSGFRVYEESDPFGGVSFLSKALNSRWCWLEASVSDSLVTHSDVSPAEMFHRCAVMGLREDRRLPSPSSSVQVWLEDSLLMIRSVCGAAVSL